MVADSVSGLVDTLLQSGILEPEQRDELPRLTPRFRDPKALARELVQRGWLTPFQANRLAQNRVPELVLGSYVLLEQIAEGGMGQVYKAKHAKFGRIVALKVIHKDKLAKRGAVERFRREVRAAAALDHPNIVHAFDADQVGDRHFLVLEYVDGENLTNLVVKKGPLPVTEAADAIRQAALGLQQAHERGMVHRDIKPSNLLRAVSPGPDGRPRTVVKILDMGLVRLTHDEEQSGALTQFGTVLGTPDFIAPEQARNTHAADVRSDIYSLGCTFYFILTGKVPFPDGTTMEKLLKHQFDEPTPVERVRPEMIPGMGNVLRKMLAKKPEDRFETPAEVAAALEPYCRPVAVPLAMPVDVEPLRPAWMTSSTSDVSSPTPILSPRLRREQQARDSSGTTLLLLGGGLLAAMVFGAVILAGLWYALSGGGDSRRRAPATPGRTAIQWIAPS